MADRDLYSRVDGIDKKLDQLIAAGGISLAPVLDAVAALQADVDNILDFVSPDGLPPFPVVDSISPTSGLVAGGETVTVSGSGFTGATAVFFGMFSGTSLAVISDVSLTVVSPAQVAGTVDVAVLTSGGASATGPGSKFILS